MDESVDTPGSVPRRRRAGWPTEVAVATIHLGRSLLTGSSALPVGIGRAALVRRLLELAPGGVYRADLVTQVAGGLLHHLSLIHI